MPRILAALALGAALVAGPLRAAAASPAQVVTIAQVDEALRASSAAVVRADSLNPALTGAIRGACAQNVSVNIILSTPPSARERHAITRFPGCRITLVPHAVTGFGLIYLGRCAFVTDGAFRPGAIIVRIADPRNLGILADALRGKREYSTTFSADLWGARTLQSQVLSYGKDGPIDLGTDVLNDAAVLTTLTKAGEEARVVLDAGWARSSQGRAAVARLRVAKVRVRFSADAQQVVVTPRYCWVGSPSLSDRYTSLGGWGLVLTGSDCNDLRARYAALWAAAR